MVTVKLSNLIRLFFRIRRILDQIRNSQAPGVLVSNWKTSKLNILRKHEDYTPMVLILDGNLEYVAHARRKIGIFREKISDL